MGLFWIFLISIPIFYIVGIVSFISSVFGKHDSPNYDDRIAFLERSIQDLKEIALKNPSRTISAQIKEYEKEYQNNVQKVGIVVEKSGAGSVQKLPPTPKKVSQTDISVLWSNWYSNNSINLLLYIGAFLIVASAAIFVGFQWESISGTIKASLMTVLALAFFACGFWFYALPKIRTAGATFIGIGSLLIPVCGAAWYNFVLKDMGATPGPVWLVTSLVSLIIYAFLAFNFENIFYTYIASLTTISFSFAVVNTLGIDNKFYIFAASISSFLLLLTSLIFKNTYAKLQKTFAVPLETSSQILMPTTLLYGLYIALSSNQLFSFEASLALFIGSGFYFLSYYLGKQSWTLFVGEFLLPFGVIFFFRAENLNIPTMLYTVALIGCTYISLAGIFEREKKQEESDLSIMAGLAACILVFFDAYVRHLAPIHLTLFAFIPAFAGLGITYTKKSISYVGISTFFLGIGALVAHFELFKFSAHPEYLSLAFCICALVFYAIAYLYRSREDFKMVFGISSAAYFAASLLLVTGQTNYLLIVSLLLTGITIHAADVFEAGELLYLSNLFLYFSIWNGIRLIDIPHSYAILLFAAVSYILYFAHLAVPQGWRKQYRYSALAGSLATPFIGIFSMASLYAQAHTIEMYSLITSYAATFLFGIDTLLVNAQNFGYLTSAIGVATYLWQIHFLGVTELLMYTIPLGIYFLVLAYLQKRKGNSENTQALNILGLFLSIAPATFLSLGADAFKYSLVLGIEGILFFFAGISNSEKSYRYTGIFCIVVAVISQTYQYIFLLPRWVVVGGVGAVFIGLAIFLLLKRKTDE